MSVGRSKAGTKKRSPDGLSHPNQNTIIILKNMVIFYKELKMSNKIQLTKNKMDLNNRKMTLPRNLASIKLLLLLLFIHMGVYRYLFILFW